jgi:alkanesulfonate monooxygenase SsuD/methylene tetrahydromethanopterin reductase-like flavin-dependent oxidoreductase (luciferase family)
MSQEFVPDDNLDVSEALEEDRPNDASAVSEQEVVRITVVGSPAAVLETIHTLYRLGFAQVGDWSPPQRGAKPGQVISVLIRRSRKA